MSDDDLTRRMRLEYLKQRAPLSDAQQLELDEVIARQKAALKDDLSRIFERYTRQARERQEQEDLRKLKRDLRAMSLESRSSLDSEETQELEELRLERQREADELSIRTAAMREAWGFSREPIGDSEDRTSEPQQSESAERASDGRPASGIDLPEEEFPERAAWLKAQMRARGVLTPTRIQALGGPHHRTVQKVLDGGAVRDDVLERLATALTEAQRDHPISLADIPMR